MRKAEDVKKAKEEEETLYAKEDELYEGKLKFYLVETVASYRPSEWNKLKVLCCTFENFNKKTFWPQQYDIFIRIPLNALSP